MEPLSFGRLWPETVAALKRHLDLLLPVAAAFLFLPQLLFAWHLGDVQPDQIFKGERLWGDLAAIALLATISLIGQLSIAFLVFHDGTADRTLGQVLKGAVLLLLPGIAATLIQGMAVGFGLIFLLIPGFWMLARLSVTIPLLATATPDPIQALRGSWQLTSGHSLRILGMLSILFLGFMMITLGITGLGSAVGVITTVVAGKPAEGWGVGRWLFEALAAGASALFGMAYVAFLAILTRALQAQRGQG